MPIAVRSHGAHGPVVAVLHGGPGAPGSAAGLARVLAPHFRVLEPLQRQRGGVPLTVEQHVDDMAAVLPPRVALVGWSWGAMLGLSYAALHPARVQALVLVGCGTYSHAERELFAQAMARKLGRDGRGHMAALAELLEHATDAAERDGALAELGRLATVAQAYALLDDDEAAVSVDAQGHHETWQDVLRLQAQGIEPARFATIAAPVLMLHGEDDPHPGQATRDTLRLILPQLEYQGLARCGHMPWRERYARDSFVETLQAWLTRHAAASDVPP